MSSSAPPDPLAPFFADTARVELAHGAGGRTMAKLIERLFRRAFASPLLDRGNDQAVFDAPRGRLAMSTDSFVVSPPFFPGGNIGSLAVHGTVNDVAMSGARPLYLSAGFILEEGFSLAALTEIAESMGRAAREAGVEIVTGDTKVVERGKGDGVFINTTGLGVIPEGVAPSAERARPGDRLLVSGTLGDHGVAILSTRQDLGFETELLSDAASLHGLVAALVAAVPGVRVLRDPTRGGLAAALNELALASGVGFCVEEAAVPLSEAVRGACELLGLDAFHMASEGKLLAIVAPEDAARALAALRGHPLGRDAALIGEVTQDPHRFVTLTTRLGGRRVLDWPAAEPLPRIC